MEKAYFPSSQIPDFSEEFMANSFEKLICSENGLTETGVFDNVFRELPCRQGIPDFVAVRNILGENPRNLPPTTGLVEPSILSMLKPTAPRTLSFIITHSEFSDISVKKSLKSLESSGRIEKTNTNCYRLTKSPVKSKTEIWAFELKLSNPRRAVFQSQQNRAFANKAIIVVPFCREKGYAKYYETMKRWGIGLAVFDPITLDLRYILRGRKSKALSENHRTYALSQMQQNEIFSQ